MYYTVVVYIRYYSLASLLDEGFILAWVLHQLRSGCQTYEVQPLIAKPVMFIDDELADDDSLGVDLSEASRVAEGCSILANVHGLRVEFVVSTPPLQSSTLLHIFSSPRSGPGLGA
jgi:hypothetical protein